MQGPDAIGELPAILSRLGKRPFVVVDAEVDRLLGGRFDGLFRQVDGEVKKTLFSGEVTYAVIDVLTSQAGAHDADVVIGIGGGKAIDAAKGAANRQDTKLVTVPTIASNDSPTAKVLAVYDDNHVMVAIERDGRSPDVVLVDTSIIASAPKAFLIAGIGDAISKKFEAEGCIAGGGINSYHTKPLQAALVLADGCYRQIRSHAVQALADIDKGIVTPAVEDLIESVILMSGVGYENGGLSIAHSMTRGLVVPETTKRAAHGLHVAYGLLVQLLLEQRDDEFMNDMLGFYRSIGLPTSVHSLGGAVDDGDIELIARLSMAAPHVGNLSRPVDTRAMIAAMERLEAMQRPKD